MRLITKSLFYNLIVGTFVFAFAFASAIVPAVHADDKKSDANSSSEAKSGSESKKDSTADWATQLRNLGKSSQSTDNSADPMTVTPSTPPAGSVGAGAVGTGADSKPDQAAVSAPKDFSPQDDEKARKFRGELHAKKGAEMVKYHKYAQAESEFKEAAKWDEKLEYLESYAKAAQSANDPRESIESYTRLLKADAAHHPEGYAIIAESLYKMHRYDESVDAYKKALPFEKDKLAIWHKIAEIRLLQVNHPEAIDAYKNAIKVAPEDGKAYKLLAAMQWNVGSKADAFRTYKEGVAHAPKDSKLQAAYAYALMSNQQWQEAANAYKAAAMIEGSTPELKEGYQSAMDHIKYEQHLAEIEATKGKKHHKKPSN